MNNFLLKVIKILSIVSNFIQDNKSIWILDGLQPEHNGESPDHPCYNGKYFSSSFRIIFQIFYGFIWKSEIIEIVNMTQLNSMLENI